MIGLLWLLLNDSDVYHLMQDANNHGIVKSHSKDIPITLYSNFSADNIWWACLFRSPKGGDFAQWDRASGLWSIPKSFKYPSMGFICFFLISVKGICFVGVAIKGFSVLSANKHKCVWGLLTVSSLGSDVQTHKSSFQHWVLLECKRDETTQLAVVRKRFIQDFENVTTNGLAQHPNVYRKLCLIYILTLIIVIYT